MPIYNYHCPSCDKSWESFNHIDDRRKEKCAQCGSDAAIKPSTSARTMIYPYYSEQLNSMVTSPKQREKLAKEKGMIPIG